jgi:hypothetical protein
MEVVSYVLSFVGGVIATLAVTFGKPWAADWQAKQRERRARRLNALDMVSDGVRGRMGFDNALISEQAALIDDRELSAYVGRYTTADTPEKKSDAQGDAMNRIGHLRRAI